MSLEKHFRRVAAPLVLAAATTFTSPNEAKAQNEAPATETPQAPDTSPEAVQETQAATANTAAATLSPDLSQELKNPFSKSTAPVAQLQQSAQNSEVVLPSSGLEKPTKTAEVDRAVETWELQKNLSVVKAKKAELEEKVTETEKQLQAARKQVETLEQQIKIQNIQMEGKERVVTALSGVIKLLGEKQEQQEAKIDEMKAILDSKLSAQEKWLQFIALLAGLGIAVTIARSRKKEKDEVIVVEFFSTNEDKKKDNSTSEPDLGGAAMPDEMAANKPVVDTEQLSTSSQENSTAENRPLEVPKDMEIILLTTPPEEWPDDVREMVEAYGADCTQKTAALMREAAQKLLELAIKEIEVERDDDGASITALQWGDQNKLFQNYREEGGAKEEEITPLQKGVEKFMETVASEFAIMLMTTKVEEWNEKIEIILERAAFYPDQEREVRLLCQKAVKSFVEIITEQEEVPEGALGILQEHVKDRTISREIIAPFIEAAADRFEDILVENGGAGHKGVEARQKERAQQEGTARPEVTKFMEDLEQHGIIPLVEEMLSVEPESWSDNTLFVWLNDRGRQDGEEEDTYIARAKALYTKRRLSQGMPESKSARSSSIHLKEVFAQTDPLAELGQKVERALRQYDEKKKDKERTKS